MSKGSVKGITIEIEGKTSGLTKSLKEADAALAKTDRALKEVEKALELDPSNIELAAQKEALLAEKADLTSKRLEVLKQVQKDALTQLESGAEVSTASLAELSAEIVSTEKSLDGMDGAANGASNEMKEIGDNADTAGKKTANFGEAAKKAGAAAKKAFEIAAKAVAAIGAAVGTAVTGAVKLGKKVTEMASEIGEAGDVIDKQSQKVGLSAEAYQEWDYAMNLAGASMENMGTGLKTMTNQIDAAKKGNKDAIARFKELGISLKDLKTMSREDIFSAAIAGFQGMADSTDRAALASKMFGKSGQELAPLFNMTREETAEAIQQAHEYGMVMSDELVKSAADYEDALTQMNGTMKGVKNDMIGGLLPGMTLIAEGISDLFSGEDISGDKLLEGVNSITDNLTTEIIPKLETFITTILPVLTPALATLFSSIGSVLSTLTETLLPPILQALQQDLPGLIQSFADFVVANMSLFTGLINSVLPSLISLIVTVAPPLIEALMNGLIENASVLLPAAMSLIITLIQGISEALPELIPIAIEAIMLLVNTFLEPSTLKQLLEAGIKILIAVIDGISSVLPELIPTIIEAIGVIVDTLIEHTPELLEAGIKLIMSLISGLVQAIPEIIAQGPRFLSGIQEMLADIPGKLVEMATTWGADLISNMIQGFQSKMSNLKTAVGNIASTIKGFLGFSVPEEGPLHSWQYNNPGADMIDLFSEGMYSQMGTLEGALNKTAGVIAAGLAPDYSVQLAGISGHLAGIESKEQKFVIPVSIGSDRLGVAVAKAQNNNNYRSGGH